MVDCPIIFSAPMVRALLDGRKTMTRRLAWKVEERGPRVDGLQTIVEKVSPWQKVRAGDRLWVRENAWICPPNWTDTPANPMGPLRQEVAYQADDLRGGTAEAARDYKLKLYPSIHMPRWASRLTLLVTATKIERLRDISSEDAEAEGVKCDMSARTFVDHFRDLWGRLHGAGAWDVNPEVVALSFTVHQTNIDKMTEAA